jgi:hypothetical protein
MRRQASRSAAVQIKICDAKQASSWSIPERDAISAGRRFGWCWQVAFEGMLLREAITAQA